MTTKHDKITAKSLKGAMRASNQIAYSENKRLGLDMVYLHDGKIVREKADGSTFTIRKIASPVVHSSKRNEPFKIH